MILKIATPALMLALCINFLSVSNTDSKSDCLTELNPDKTIHLGETENNEDVNCAVCISILSNTGGGSTSASTSIRHQHETEVMNNPLYESRTADAYNPLFSH